MYAIVCAALIGQVSMDMGTELGPNALDQLPAVAKPAPRKSRETSAQRIVRLEKRAEATARIAAAKAERMERVYQRAGDRAYARRARLASGYPSPYAQRLQAAYGRQFASHAVWMGYIRPTPPSCSTTRVGSYTYRN